MHRTLWLFCLTLLAGTGATLWLLWGSAVPLGIPGEWTWNRIPAAAETMWGWVLAGGAAALYAGYVLLAARGLENETRRYRVAARLLGLIGAGFVWLGVVQESPPDAYRLSKVPLVLYYPASSGYFFHARYEMADTGSFLAGYEEWMAEGDVLHIGTHPPGLFLAHRGLLELCRSSPWLTGLLLATQPGSVEDAFDTIEQLNRRSATPLQPGDRAALWLAFVVTQLAAVATIVPLYLLVRRFDSRRVSWFVAALWSTIPALAVFLPKSDALYPLIGMTLLWAWLEGWNRRSLLLCGLAGFLFWLGMFLSLALIPVAVLAAGLTAWEGWVCLPEERIERAGGKLAFALFFAAIGFLLPVVLLWWVADLNLFVVWSWNYRNHAAFYDQFTRTWWKWLLVNPLELLLAVGVPICAAVLSGSVRLLRSSDRFRRRAGPLWCCLAVWVLLWLSGKNSGEAARLWLFLMPWFVWLTAEFWATHERAELDSRSALRLPLALLCFQLAVGIATMTRVSGFHFGG